MLMQNHIQITLFHTFASIEQNNYETLQSYTTLSPILLQIYGGEFSKNVINKNPTPEGQVLVTP